MTKGHLTSLVMVVLQKQPVDLEGAGREAVAEGLISTGQRSRMGSDPDLVHLTSTLLLKCQKLKPSRVMTLRRSRGTSSHPSSYSRETEAK